MKRVPLPLFRPSPYLFLPFVLVLAAMLSACSPATPLPDEQDESTDVATTANWSMQWHHIADAYCLCYEPKRKWAKTKRWMLTDSLLVETDAVIMSAITSQNTSKLKDYLASISNYGRDTPKHAWDSRAQLLIRSKPSSIPLAWKQLGLVDSLFQDQILLTPSGVILMWPFGDDRLQKRVKRLNITIPELKTTEFNPQRDLMVRDFIATLDNKILADSHVSKQNLVNIQQQYPNDERTRSAEMLKVIRSTATLLPDDFPDNRTPDNSGTPIEHVPSSLRLSLDISKLLTETRFTAYSNHFTLDMGYRPPPMVPFQIWPCGD